MYRGTGVSRGVRRTTWDRSLKNWELQIPCFEVFSGEGTLWDSSLPVSLSLWDTPALFTPHFPSPKSCAKSCKVAQSRAKSCKVAQSRGKSRKIGENRGSFPMERGSRRKGALRDLPAIPKGPKIEKIQERPPGLKSSSEIENFKRATQQTPIFCGEF